MKQSCDVIIRAEILITQDAARTILHDAGLAVRADTIVDTGAWKSVQAQWSAPTKLDLQGKLVMPGLVNAHTHAAMSILRGLADDMPLMQWLTEHIFPVEKHLSAEIIEIGALLACAEMSRTGTTTFCDMYLMEQATFRAADKAGLRIQGGEGIFAFPSPAYKDIDAAFDLMREQHAAFKGHTRIRQAVMPHAVYTTTPTLLRRCEDLAAELGCRLHMHLAESPAETAQCVSSFGKRPVGYCHELGLLDENITIAHGVDITDEELVLLARAGVAVAHNPKSNMKLASGAAPVSAMLRQGMLVGLGTDGAAANNALNMFTEMTTCALLHKLQCMDPTCTPAQDVLDMATLGSARCAGWPEVGSLTIGAKADLIALDLQAPNMQPLYSATSHIVYAASGHEVTHTMVGGELVYDSGVYTRFDYSALLREVAEVRKWVRKRFV